jgi:undecaprenyl-diphosphatase
MLRAGADQRRPIGPDWLITAAIDATALGSAAVLIIIIALTAGFLAMQRQYRSMWLIIIASALGQLLSSALKTLFNRDRPDESLHLVEVSTASFPSGHAMLSAVVYLTLGVVLATTRQRKREKTYIMLAALLLTGIVGITRVYIGVHYVTDVLAGWAVGLCWAMLCLLVALRLQHRSRGGATMLSRPQGAERE